MWVFTEVADWFEKNRAESDQVLDQWVEDSNYNTGVMAAAAATKAFTTFGAGFVDILRLGDGVKEGSLKGVGTDALRVVAIFPVGKVANLVKSTRGLNAARLIADTGGPNCSGRMPSSEAATGISSFGPAGCMASKAGTS